MLLSSLPVYGRIAPQQQFMVVSCLNSSTSQHISHRRVSLCNSLKSDTNTEDVESIWVYLREQALVSLAISNSAKSVRTALFRSDASKFTVMALRDLTVDVSVVDLTVETEEVTTWMRPAQR